MAWKWLRPRAVIRPAFGLTTAVLTVFLGDGPLRACPFCASETGRRVKAGVFNADFAANVAVTLLPFVVFLAIIASIHFGWPWAGGQSSRSDHQASEDQTWTRD